jgi:SAM-dependent methyltransferase
MPSLCFLASVLLYARSGLDQAGTMLSYLAVSTMSLDEFREELVRAWADFNPTDAEILDGLMTWEERQYERVRPGQRLLLVGCGSGRDLFPLLDRECEVVGIEPSAGALARASALLARQGRTARLVVGYFEDVAIEGAFDVVSFSFFCYSYIPMRRRRIEVLRKARRLLAPGGRILVSYSPAERRGRGRLIRLARMCSALFRSDWVLEEGDLVWPVVAEVPTIVYQHLFIPGELAQEAREAGLSVEFEGVPQRDPFLVLVAE